MRYLKKINLNKKYVLELYLENVESLFFDSNDVEILEIEYSGKLEKYTMVESGKEIEVEEYVNSISRIKLIISKTANKIVPFISMGMIQDIEEENNFERLLDGCDITFMYFIYGNSVFYGQVPYDRYAPNPLSNCKYYLDEEGNLIIDLKHNYSHRSFFLFCILKKYFI